MEYRFLDNIELTTKEKQVLRKLCVHPEFGCWVDYNGVKIVLAEEDGVILGWAAIHSGIIGVYIRKKFRGKGTGSKLVEMILNEYDGEIIASSREKYPAGREIFAKYPRIKDISLNLKKIY